MSKPSKKSNLLYSLSRQNLSTNQLVALCTLICLNFGNVVILFFILWAYLVSDRRAASGDQATVNPACMQRTATTGIVPTTQQTETSIQR